MKAAINTADVRGELSLLLSEFQRASDIANYSKYVNDRADGSGHQNPTSMMDRTREAEQKANTRMAVFTHQALTGILNLLEA